MWPDINVFTRRAVPPLRPARRDTVPTGDRFVRGLRHPNSGELDVCPFLPTRFEGVLGSHPGGLSRPVGADADLQVDADGLPNVRDRVAIPGRVDGATDRDDVVAADKKRQRVVGFPHITHQFGVPLFDVDKRVELVELVGVFAGRVVDVEVRDPNVPVGSGRVGEGVTAEDLPAVAVLCAAGVLEVIGRGSERRRRGGVDSDAQAHCHRVPVADRLLNQGVIGGVEAVSDGDHVVEAGEEDVSLAVPDKL